jgi:predicted hotdog family 3-hydroxylacyl-ACP dehydratase
MPAVPHTADMLGILHTVEMRDAKSKCRKKVFQTGAAIARRTNGNVHKRKSPALLPGF